MQRRRVSLRDLADAYEGGGNESFFHVVDVETGEVLMIYKESGSGYVEPTPEMIEERERVDEGFGVRYFKVDPHDLREADLVDDFVQEQSPRAADRLARAFSGGRGRFRRFKDTADDLGLLEKWFHFRRAHALAAARRFCEAHELEWVDDDRE